MAFDSDEAEAFIQRVDDAFVARGEGQWQVDPEALRRLARENSELFILACRSWVFRAQQGGTKQRGNSQAAMALASAFTAEYGDDAVETVIRDELTALGVEVPEPTTTVIDAATDPDTEAPPIAVQIDADTLRRQDTYALVKLFGHQSIEDDDRMAQLRGLRARCCLTFPIPLTDAREVWEVPEVREFVTRVNASLPYLPYFLGRWPDFNAVHIWWLCLAPDDALVADAGLDLNNNQLAAQLGYTAYITELFARLVDDDSGAVRRDLLVDFPADFAAEIWSLADHLADEDRDGD